MIFGPQYSRQILRLQPIDGNPSDDNRDEKQKRRVLYQGRSWSESEEDLPVQPVQVKEEKKQSRQKNTVYFDPESLEKIQAYFDCLITLEDKIAQLFFYQTEAYYDQERQHAVDFLIQKWQMGGVLFSLGDYKRQAFLIEHYQSLCKVPLLIANDFLHGLSFYFEGHLSLSSLQQALDEKKLVDLGKAVVAQNRRIGVHLQFESERERSPRSLNISMTNSQSKAFRKGVRDADGMVAKEKKGIELSSPYLLQTTSSDGRVLAFSRSGEIQETIGIKTLHFYDLTDVENLEEKLLSGFQSCYDVFLCSENLQAAIKILAQAVKKGKIHEEEINRRVKRLLYLKTLFFKSQIRKAI